MPKKPFSKVEKKYKKQSAKAQEKKKQAKRAKGKLSSRPDYGKKVTIPFEFHGPKVEFTRNIYGKKGRLEGKSIKQISAVYKDAATGRIIKPEKLDGRKIRVELWRYHPDTKKREKIDFKHDYLRHIQRIKNPLKPKRIQEILRQLRGKFRVFIVNGEVYMLTGS